MNEMHWLAATCLMTASLWMIYVLNRMVVLGFWRTVGNPAATDPPLAPWAQRAQAAHRNAVENLAVFAPLVLAAQSLGLNSSLTLLACQGYFFARLTHWLVYTAGIPAVRTLAFAAGWVAQLTIALIVLGLLQ